MMQPFTEMDRILKQDLHEISCYNTYELKVPLNHFSDTMHNQHLYTMYKKGKLEMPEVMRKLLCFFVWHYRAELEPKVTEYLQTKKLTIDDWLKAAKSNRHGDIVCMYFLSMITGNHTFIHLKNDKIWCTLKAIPLHHQELIKHCEIHLIYMGFRIFLQMKKGSTPLPETPVILGMITSDYPAMRALLHTMVKSEPDNMSPKHPTTAAAGSSSQLSRIEQELKVINRPSHGPEAPLPAAHKSKVKVLPFCVKLTRLSDATILKYTTKQDKNVQKVDTSSSAIASLHLKCLTIPVRKIQLSPHQSVAGKKKRLISGHPSKNQQHYTFQLQHHILKKTQNKDLFEM